MDEELIPLLQIGGNGVATGKVKSEQFGHEGGQEMKVRLDKAREILSTLSLTSVKMGNFLLVLKSDFDLDISGEPYIALMLILDLRSGRHISRVWNQTVSTGCALGEGKLMEACKSLFCRGRPCMGHPISEKPF